MDYHTSIDYFTIIFNDSLNLAGTSRKRNKDYLELG